MRTRDATIPPQRDRYWQVYCEGGKKALGGGVSGSTTTRILESAPAGAAGDQGWYVHVFNDSPSVSVTSYAWVICANVAS